VAFPRHRHVRGTQRLLKAIEPEVAVLAEVLWQGRAKACQLEVGWCCCCVGLVSVSDHFLPPDVRPVRNSTTSPSCITYSLPSMRTQPLALASAMEPASMSWSKETISALMKPRSKSVWMTPAACGAVAPLGTVHARDAFGPAVR